MGHLNLGNILFMFHHIHVTFKFREFGAAASNTCDGYDFNIDIINNDEYNAVQKKSLMMFEGFCIFGFQEFLKNFFCILMEVNKTMYEK